MKLQVELETQITMSKTVIIEVPDDFDMSNGSALFLLGKKVYKADDHYWEGRQDYQRNLYDEGYSEDTRSEGDHTLWVTRTKGRPDYVLTGDQVMRAKKE